MADDNKTVEIILKVNAAQLRKGMANATTSYAGSTQKIVQANQQATTSTGALTGKVLGLAAAYVSVSQSINLVKSLLSTGGNFESLRVQLETLTGSAEAGEAAFDWVRSFVKETPFGLDAVTQGFIKLKAFGLDPIDGTYQAIADQAAALGGGQEKLNGIILAVGQAWAKQKLQGEEILQLVERGVPVWDLLAQATGKNVTELQKLSEQGKLGRDVIAQLITEMGKGVDGAALDQVKTWNGLVSNARVEWQSFLDTIAQSGALDYFKNELSDLLEEVQRLAESGELEQYAQEVGEAIVTAAEALKSMVNLMTELSTVIQILITVGLANKFLVPVVRQMWRLAEAAFASSVAIKAVNANIKIMKGLATFGLAVALDFAISKFIEMSEEAGKAADDQKQLAKEIEDGQRAIREEMSKPVDDQVKKSLDAALTAQRAFNSDFAKAKAAETNFLRNELARQLDLYDKHLKDLAAAQKQQQSIAKEFANFVRDIGQGSGQQAPPDIIDFYASLEAARTQLREGDFDGAIDGARNLAEMVQTMRDNGQEADLVLRELARQTEKLANDAASEKVDDETKKLEQAKLTINELVESSALLKNLEIGFNTELAKKSVNELRQMLHENLKKQPLVFPVQFSTPVEFGTPRDLKAANDLLEKSGANNPLIPDVPVFEPDASPIVRAVELDTSQADQALDRIEKRATRELALPVRPIYREGNVFSDVRSHVDGVRREALKGGNK